MVFDQSILNFLKTGLRKLGRVANDRINLCRVLAFPLPPSPSGHFNATFPTLEFRVLTLGVGVRVACPQPARARVTITRVVVDRDCEYDSNPVYGSLTRATDE